MTCAWAVPSPVAVTVDPGRPEATFKLTIMAMGYVRPARKSDAEEIARIQLSTWRAAFADVVPADVLDELSQDWLAGHWRESCAAPPSSAHQIFVAVEQNESDRADVRSVGFAAVGPDTDAAEDPDEDSEVCAEVTELLVEPRFGRRGHGSRLLSAAVAHWREHHVETARAWLFVRDPASLAFYKSAGWDVDGARRSLHMGGEQIPQLRLHADVVEAPE